MTDSWPFVPYSLYCCDVPEALFLAVSALYSWSIACSLIYTYFLSTLCFCGTKFINNFVCEQAAIVAISCSDPYINQEIILVSATFNEVSSLMIIHTSCVFIFITVLRMLATGGGVPQSLLHLCLPSDHHYHLPRDHPFPLLLLLLSHFSHV